jgi:hypothetical protein
VSWQSSDPLKRRGLARVLVTAVAVTICVAFVLSAKHDDEPALPAITLNSPFLLDFERAILVGALVAATLVFLIRGWAGHFPSKISTSGAEYPSPTVLAELNESDTDAASTARELRARQKVFTDGFRIVAQRLATLETDFAELQRKTDMDDTL